MPKVLRILNRFNLGGPTYNAAYLTKYMAPEYETILVGGSIDDTEASSNYILNNLGIHPIIIPEMKRALNPLSDQLAYAKIKRIIRRIQPDIVHTHASKAGALGRRAAISMNVPVIVHTFHGHVFHNYFNPVKTSVFKTIEKRLASKSSKIVAISETQKHELSVEHQICAPEKIAVIPLGFDLNRFQDDMEGKRRLFRQKYQLAEDEIAIGIIGRLVPIKNHAMFLQVVKEVFETTSKKVRAFIIGDGEERANIQQQASELNIPWVDYTSHPQKMPLTFTSWIKEVDQVMAGLDLIALTSLNEGTPVSLIEALAANKPVVSTRVGGIEDVVDDGLTGLLSTTGDVHKFTYNTLKIIEQQHLRLKLSEQGWDKMKHKYHFSRLVGNMNDLYNQLLSLHY